MVSVLSRPAAVAAIDDLRCCVTALRPRPRAVLAAIAAGIMASGSALALAGLAAWLIARAWTMPPVLSLSVAVTAVRALGISRGLFRYLERLASHRVALAGLTEVRATLYGRLADAPADYAIRLRAGDLWQRTGADVDEVGNIVVRTIIPSVVALVVSVAAAVWLALVSVPAALIAMAAMVIAGIVAPALSVMGASKAVRAGEADRAAFTDAATLVFFHHDELAVAGTLSKVLRTADAAESQRIRAVDYAARALAWARAAAPFGTGVTVVAALTIAVLASAQHPLAPTTLAVLILLPLSAFEALSPLPDAAAQLHRSALAARRLRPLLDAPAAVSPSRPRRMAVQPALGCPEVPNSIAAGERLLVTGRSGSGKTTLLMTLAGLHPGGLFDGQPASDFDANDAARVVSYFAEDAHIFATTVRENCRVAAGDADDRRIRDALTAVGLTQWLAALPDGLDTVLPGGRESLSAGQRRRLLLARAVLAPATVVLLDEPVEHLDRADAADLLGQILAPRGLFAGRTVVVASHLLPAKFSGKSIAMAESAGVPSSVHKERRWSELKNLGLVRWRPARRSQRSTWRPW